MSEPTTIREYLEAIASYWESCPAVVMEHAGAALALLDNAFWHEDLGRSAMCRLIPDPWLPPMSSHQRDPRLAWIGATDAYQTSTQPVRLTIIITYTRPK